MRQNFVQKLAVTTQFEVLLRSLGCSLINSSFVIGVPGFKMNNRNRVAKMMNWTLLFLAIYSLRSKSIDHQKSLIVSRSGNNFQQSG